MLRPMTSNVSALSGIVANGHQAIHSVSSAPSQIPYGGFSPVRLQAGCQTRPSPSDDGFDAATVEVSSVRVLFRSRACVRRHSRPLTPHTCPVALGSASGYAVRRPHRLLWPHPSFCAAPPVSFIYGRRISRNAEGPQFGCQSLMTCRRPYSDGPQGSPTNLNPWLGLRPFGRGSAAIWSTHRTTCGGFTKLQRSLNAAARHLACPAPDGTFTTELACAESPPTQVGHDYRNVRLIPDRTRTGCSGSFMGCTPNPTTRGAR